MDLSWIEKFEKDGQVIKFSSGPFEVETLYNQVRDKEGRLLDDHVVKHLPESGLTSAHGSEWKVRKRSAEILIENLNKAEDPLTILDVGCGNGWLSAMMARAGHLVVALDIHMSELQQAARCFDNEAVSWCYGDLLGSELPALQFDRVVFAASIQYFPDLNKALRLCFDRLLKKDGEVHIVDSPFYANEQKRSAAKQRSVRYYKELGVPRLDEFYYHHLHPRALFDLTLEADRGWSGTPLLSMRLPFEHVVIRS